VLPPPPLGQPPIGITPEKVENNTPEKEGVKGMLPLGCLPLWGREGVTLIAAAENYQMTEKRGFQQSRNFSFVEIMGKKVLTFFSCCGNRCLRSR